MSESSKPPFAFYQAGQYQPEESLTYLMRKVLSSVLTKADARLQQHDLTYVQYLPLFRLMFCSNNTLAGLSREMEMDPAALTRSLKRLEAKKLITRTRSTTDGRVVYLDLTEEGRDVASKVPTVLAEVLNGHLTDFSHAEWQLMKQLLLRMLANGDPLRQGSAPDPLVPLPPDAGKACMRVGSG